MGALSFGGCLLDVLGAGVGLGQVSFTSSCSISDPEEESVRFLLFEGAARFTGTVGLVGVSESEEERFLFFFLPLPPTTLKGFTLSSAAAWQPGSSQAKVGRAFTPVQPAHPARL